MAFPCPGCSSPVEGSPELPLLRCGACGAILRSRSSEGRGSARAYEVEVAGRPQTRRRVEVGWSEADARRLRSWLVISSAVTLGLVLALYLLARLAG
jgi:hypothetical protein